MIHRLIAVIAALAVVVAATSHAAAHPHVWVKIASELLYAPDGSITGMRNAWTFDSMFSSFAIQGVDTKTPGTFTREQLQALAKVNAESLKDFDFFTHAKANGERRRDAFNDPIDYWFDYDPSETVLTLHFTLPFKTPVKAKSVEIEIYDPEFFIDFGFANDNAVTLVGAPAPCKVTTEKPADPNFPTTLRLDGKFETSEDNIGRGASFANKILVECP